MNLAEAWANLPKFDVVFFRNVLIYFEVEKKREILSRLVSAMRPDGYLMLGTAETTYNLGTIKAKQGKLDEALALLGHAVDHGLLPREALKLGDDPDVLRARNRGS